MSDHLVAEVAERAAQGRIVPFAGAGVSLGVRDSSGNRLFPGWVELLERAEVELEGRPERHLVRGFLETGELLEAAGRAAQGLGPRWPDLLRKALKPLRSQVDDASLDVARRLWGLGSQVVVTTNYDRVLQWACPQPDDVDRWNIEAPAELVAMAQGRLDRPAVWHLHGHIEAVEDLVLTPEGYAALYPSQVDKALKQRFLAAHAALKSLFVSHSFLFVGFSFADDVFVDQLAWLEGAFSSFAGPHYALVHATESAAIRSRLTDRARIELIEFEAFGAPMVALLDRMRPDAPRSPVAVGGAPSSENKPSPASETRAGILWPDRVDEVVDAIVDRPVQPLILFGSRDSGRTTLLSDVIGRLTGLDGYRVARVDLDMLPGQRQDTLAETLHYIMGRVGSVLEAELPAAFASNPEAIFPTAVEQALSSLGDDRLVLCIDDFDVALGPHPEIALAFFAQLRGLAVRAKAGIKPMERLSLILTARHLQKRHLDTKSSPLPGVARAIEIGPIRTDELFAYALGQNVSMDHRDAGRLLDETGGHPPLVRRIIDHAADGGEAIGALLERRHGLYDDYVEVQRGRLGRLSRLYGRDLGPPLSTEITLGKASLGQLEREALVELGLIVNDSVPAKWAVPALKAVLS